MSLIKCPECGYEGMSSHAEHCPRCGAPYWPARRIIAMLAIGLCVTAACLAIYLYTQYRLSLMVI